MQSKSPEQILKELVQVTRPNNPREAVFVTHLFRISQSDPHLDLKHVLMDLSENIKELQRAIGVDHLLIWQRIYQKLRMEEDAAWCIREAKTRSPVNVADLCVLIDLLEDEESARALDIIKEWRLKHPDNRALKVRYLTLLENKFFAQFQEVISQPSEWIKDPGDNWDVVEIYFDMVITHVPDLIPDVASKISRWLREHENHRGAAAIWIPYLKLIAAQHDSRLMKDTLHDCWEWLLQHREERGYILLAHFYVGVIDK